MLRRRLEQKHEAALGGFGGLNPPPPPPPAAPLHSPPVADQITVSQSTPNIPLATWGFPLAQLTRRLTAYPRAKTILHELDQEAGGERYEPYGDLFEKGLYFKSIGEILSWVHTEARRAEKQPETFLRDAFKDILSVDNPNNQHQVEGLVGLIVPPVTLVGVMLREFERAAIRFEAADA
jgi:hypothetical protein